MSRASRLVSGLSLVSRVLVFIFCVLVAAQAADWSIPEQELARKIAAVTGSGAASLSFENRSSLGRRDAEIVQNGLRSALESAGIRVASGAATTITISLSENVDSYVWVAQIKPAAGEGSVTMVATPRPPGVAPVHDSVPLTLRKTSLWQQNDAILDVAVLEENVSPVRIAVLGAGRVSVYRMQSGGWQQEQAMEIPHTNPWPRDLRGRLVPANDHLLDVYLPGVFCQTSGTGALILTCHESSDPWPLSSKSFGAVGTVRGTFASGRNFFSGMVMPGMGNTGAVPSFYTAAPVIRDKTAFWLLSELDGQAHAFDGANDRVLQENWGSDIAALRTSCGAGWQILATSTDDGNSDTVRAYEFPDRAPVAVSPLISFPGPISALWTEAKGDTAMAVARNEDSGSYEAFRLAVACSQ